MRTIIILILNLSLIAAVSAQMVTIEGYVFETNNRGYIQGAKVAALDGATEGIKAETITDFDGKFSMKVPQTDNGYIVVANHKLFFTKENTVDVAKADDSGKSYTRLEMERKPGYIFDVTLADMAEHPDLKEIDAIQGARIEVYNNTTFTEELHLKNHPNPTFQFNFIPGNHYTILIRKEGYLAKRVEAYVDIQGCILCFDGLGDVQPNVTEVMAHGNELGTFLANVELQQIRLNKTFKLENIYYDYDKWDIRPDAAIQLDKVVTLFTDNPSLKIELGSHTDSRGKDDYNMSLSQKRAAAAVDYLVNIGGVSSDILTSRGYGETALYNSCGNGVRCSEENHQQNRRTELKIVGIKEVKIEEPSLKSMIDEERIMQEISNSEIMVREGDPLPEELRRQFKEAEDKTEEEKN